jgi:hypothetical protein
MPRSQKPTQKPKRSRPHKPLVVVEKRGVSGNN